MKLVKYIDHTKLKPRESFDTDAAFQKYGKQLIIDLGLDDGYAYTISYDTGAVHRGHKMKVEAEKISKSG